MKYLLILCVLSTINIYSQSKDFTYVDERGCMFVVNNYELLPANIDTSFLVQNLNSKVIYLNLDTLHYDYKFIISYIKQEGELIYNVRIEEQPSIRSDSSDYSVYKSWLNSNYIMFLEQKNGKYIIRYINLISRDI